MFYNMLNNLFNNQEVKKKPETNGGVKQDLNDIKEILTDDMKRKDAEIVELREKYDFLQKKYYLLEPKNDFLQSEYDFLQSEYDSLQKDYNLLETENKSLKIEHYVICRKYDKYKVLDNIISKVEEDEEEKEET